MRILNNYIHLLALLLLIVSINTSWTADIMTNKDLLLRDMINNGKNPNGGISKEIDQRISEKITENRGNILQNQDYNVKTPAGENLTQVDLRIAENKRHIVQMNNDQHVKIPAEHILKRVDQRISDIIAENVLHFGHTLGLELAALDPYATRSEIFSPLSLMAALSLLTLGAKGNSYQELKQILALDSDSELIQNPNKYHEEFGLILNDLQHTNVNSGGVNKRPNANWRYTELRTGPVRISNRTKEPVEHIIKVANGLFVQNGYTLNPDYRQVLQSIYEAELKELDFLSRNREARDYINSWVNKATYGKIPQIIKDDIDKSTNIILASALYFKAFWETSFFFRATTEDNFYPDGVNNPPIKVQMMPTGGIFPFYDAKEYDCRIIGLPYKGNETTMYVIQPNNSTRQKLRDLQHNLDAHKINRMIDNMERKTTVMVFPKMHFTRSMHMKKILQTMNVNDIFVYGYSDLSLIGQRSPIVQQNVNYTLASTKRLLPSVQFDSDVIATKSVPVSFESIHRNKPVHQTSQLMDRYNEPALIFTSRFGDNDSNTQSVTKLKPIEILSTTESPSTAIYSSNNREKRQIYNCLSNPVSLPLLNLEANRQKIDSYGSDIYVDDILHNIDFSVDEQGTEAAAATLTYLHRSGTDVVFRGDTPFLILIRHDPTKVPLFYGIINKPEL